MNSPRQKWVLLVGMVFLVAMVTVAHWPVMSASALSFDDEQYLLNNRLVRNPSWASADRFMTEVLDPSTVEGYYQPLTMISLMLDCGMGGGPDNLRAFHRTSLALHVLNVLVLALLLNALFEDVLPATILALLFGLHPLTVDSIAWIADRKTLLGTLFALASMYLYVRYARSVVVAPIDEQAKLKRATKLAKPKSNRWALGLSVLMYVLAMMAKPTTVPLPALLLLLDFWPMRRLNVRAIWEKIPFFVMGGLFSLITLLSQARTAGVAGPGTSGVFGTFLLGCYLIVFYLGKIAWPTNLSSAYDTPSPLSLSNPTLIITALMTLALVAIVLLSLRRGRGLFAGALFFAMGLLPTVGLVRYTWTAASNKYVYLPAIGLPLVLAGAWALLRKREGQRVQTANTAILAVCLLLAAGEIRSTRGYLREWNDTLTLAEHMLECAPHCAAVHNHLGQVLASRDRLDEAIPHFMEAMRTEPNYREAQYNLGITLRLAGRADEAAKYLNATLASNPKDTKAHHELAMSLQSQGQADKALEHFRAAVQLDPGDPFGHYSLANALAKRGDQAAAINEFREALRLDPKYADAECDLGSILASEGKTDEAMSHLQRALQLKPDYAEAHSNLGSILARQGNLNAAMEHFRDALAAQPQHARANYNLGLALELQGKPDEAVTHYRKALATDADYVDALNHLGTILAKRGQFDEAIELFQRIVTTDPHNAEARHNLELARKLKSQTQGQAMTATQSS